MNEKSPWLRLISSGCTYSDASEYITVATTYPAGGGLLVKQKNKVMITRT